MMPDRQHLHRVADDAVQRSVGQPSAAAVVKRVELEIERVVFEREIPAQRVVFQRLKLTNETIVLRRRDVARLRSLRVPLGDGKQ